jgi:hypothetical protein
MLKRLVSSDQGIDMVCRELKELLKQQGHFFVVTQQGSRSIAQNSLYWEWIGRIGPFINEKWNLNQTKENTHDLMRHLHLGYRQVPTMGKTDIPEQLKSTTDLSPSQMAEFMKRIDMWCAQMGLLLPRPEDGAYAQYLDEQRGG